MEFLIYDIVRILRKSGINVSIHEISDCIHALKAFGGDSIDKYTLYEILNTTLVKTEWGSRYVQSLVELYFEPDEELASDRNAVLSTEVTSSMGTGSGRAGKGAPVDVLMDAVLKKDVELIYAMVKGYASQLFLRMENGDGTQGNLKLESGWFEVSGRIEDAFGEGRLSPADYEAAREVLEEWELFLKEEYERFQEKNMDRDHAAEVLKRQNPKYMNFLDVQDYQYIQMSREVEKLARKLAVKKGRRRKVGKKGRISITRTIKHAMQTGGIPFKLVKMDTKPAKPDIWLLCDMSNSVRKFSYFMLLFVYTVQKYYKDIRSFIFVDELLEVTGHFREQDWKGALESVGSLKGYNSTGYSHYGNVLHQFAGNLAQLDKKTTVLVLGDGKNNWNRLDGSDVLHKINERAHALYWLNPLDTELWDMEDSVMGKYVQNCTAACQCANIEQLDRFITDYL